MKQEVPESPNFIYLLYQIFKDHPWAAFLHRWENIIFSGIVAISIASVFYLGTRKSTFIPSGLQNALELIVEKLEGMLTEILGPHGPKYLPFLGTLFLYIFCMNWMGLIPFMKTPTSNLSITAAFAICVFFYVQYLNIRNQGVIGFLYHLAGSPKDLVGWLIVPIILPLELLTQISRPVTLALRLSGNMLGEHILIAVFAFMGVIWLTSAAIPITIPVQIPIIFLALLTGFMQALVFTVLSTVYILLSIPEHR